LILGAIASLGVDLGAGKAFFERIGFLCLCGVMVGTYATHAIGQRLAEKSLRRDLIMCDSQLCQECGYMLAGLPDGHACPECGTAYSHEMLRAFWSQWLGAARTEA